MAPRPQRTENRKLRVLVVDDDAGRRSAFERVLREMSVEFRCAEPTFAAVDARVFKPDATVAVFPLVTDAETEWVDALFRETGNVTFLAHEGMHSLVYGGLSTPGAVHGSPDPGAHQRIASLLKETVPEVASAA